MKRRVPTRVRPQNWPGAIFDSPDQYDFTPDRAEQRASNESSRRRKLLARLEDMRLQMLKDDERLRTLLLADMTAALEADRRRIAEILQLEETRQRRMEEIQKMHDYYEGERLKEDEARRKKVAKFAKVIAKDTAKAERERLAAKGLIRGRRK